MRMFPLFVDISRWNVVVVGGGNIGVRRVRSLLQFECSITVIAPVVRSEIEIWDREGKIQWIAKEFQNEDLANANMVMAVTQKKTVNDQVENEARKRGMLFNRCDKKSACDFHFPGLIVKDQMVIGVNSGGNDHWKAANITAGIRNKLYEE